MRRCLIGCLFIMVVMIFGCSTLGTSYTPIKSIPDGQSLVYIYYPTDPQRPGRTADFYISTADQCIVKIERGGYFPYFVHPGELKLTSKLAFKMYVSGAMNVVTSPENHITLQIHPNQTYYIEGVLYKDMGFVDKYGLRLNQVSDEFQAQIMLEDCKLLPKYVSPN